VSGCEHNRSTGDGNHISAAELATALGKTKRVGKELLCLCPAHNDHEPSLSIREQGGKLLLICRAGCRQDAVIEELRRCGLWPEPAASTDGDMYYDYKDATAKVRYQVVRSPPNGHAKKFWQRRPDGVDGWINDMAGVERLPYRLPDLLAALIIIVEGEKDVENLYRMGLTATTNSGGACKWQSAISHWFTARDVLIIPDNDDVGRKHAQEVARHLIRVAQRIRILDLPGLPDKGDVTDWLAAGGTRQELERLADRAPDWSPHDDKAGDPPGINRAIVGVNPRTLQGLEVPMRRFLLPGWIPLRRATGLYGIPGAGKTLACQMLATAGALDPARFGHKNWLGLPVKHFRSVLLFCEDDLDEMHTRQAEINHHYNCDFDDLDDMLWLPRLGEDSTLIKFDDGEVFRTPLFDELIALIAAHDVRSGLVVWDTLPDVFEGSENDRGQAKRFVQAGPGFVALQQDCSVVCTAHPSLNGMNTGTGSSGSTS
jgi:AAA domain-containing protein